jgi:hypothetical protein
VTPPRLAPTDVQRDYKEALELCARDLGTALEDLRVLKLEPHYKSTQIYVGAGGPPARTTHVIKTQPERNPTQPRSRP